MEPVGEGNRFRLEALTQQGGRCNKIGRKGHPYTAPAWLSSTWLVLIVQFFAASAHVDGADATTLGGIWVLRIAPPVSQTSCANRTRVGTTTLNEAGQVRA